MDWVHNEVLMATLQGRRRVPHTRASLEPKISGFLTLRHFGVLARRGRVTTSIRQSDVRNLGARRIDSDADLEPRL